MKYTITSLLLFVLLATGCNNQPKNTQNDIATPVSVMELKKGSISKLVNTTGTAQPTYGVTLNTEVSGLYNVANQLPVQASLLNWVMPFIKGN